MATSNLRLAPRVLLLAAAACAAPGARRVDLRPEMAAAREDAAAIAVALTRGDYPAALDPARRLARLDLSRGGLLGADFAHRAEDLRQAASRLAAAIDRDDRAAILPEFDRLVGVCAACHVVHRQSERWIEATFDEDPP
jgi:hypothetical protein